jgi:predicted dehydrogenase
MSIGWDLHDLHRLQIFDYKDDSKIRGWKSVHVTDNSPDHPYMDKWWVPGLAIGYDASFTHQVADFIEGLETGKPARPTFKDALETQAILDAMMASAKAGQWVDVK